MYEVPAYFSPSSLSTFIQCPQRFKFEKIDKIRSADTEATVRGSFVHEILEELLKLDPEHRTIEVAKSLARELWKQRWAEKAEPVANGEMTRFMWVAWWCIDTYFKMEDPKTIEPMGLEVEVQGLIEGVPLYGIVDRWIMEDGKIIVQDYKGLALDTVLPTPTGFTTMGEVQAGDQLIGGDGKPCTVKFKSEVHHNPCYRILFDDGTSVVADHEHQWEVTRCYNGKTSLMTTEQLKDNLWYCGQRDLKIMNQPGVQLPEVGLPIDPYVFGYWLGDGKNSSGEVTFWNYEAVDLIKSLGYEVSLTADMLSDGAVTTTVKGIRGALNELGVLGSKGTKFIPGMYLRSSYMQRLNLLRGLMDSDGSYNKVKNSCVFVSTNKDLADGVAELVQSLGWRVSRWTGDAKGFGVVTTQYRVTFTPYGDNPFLMPYHADKYTDMGHANSRRRLIKEVEPVDTVPTACVGVDSPNNTYLFSEAMIVTHNSGKVPKPQYSRDKKLQIMIYADLLEKQTGLEAGRMDLLYVKEGEVVSYYPTPELRESVANDVANAWDEMVASCETEQFETRTGPLCSYCDHKPYCPAFGGS